MAKIFPVVGLNWVRRLEEALIREVKEEMGLKVDMGKIIACENSFFKLPYSGKYVQSILMYYLCEIVSGKLSTKYFDAHEKEYAGEAEWVDILRINKIKIYNSTDSVEVVRKALKVAKR
jgi:ADP-ribose pyrophosphatase YjhB (NUDIX family)